MVYSLRYLVLGGLQVFGVQRCRVQVWGAESRGKGSGCSALRLGLGCRVQGLTAGLRVQDPGMQGLDGG